MSKGQLARTPENFPKMKHRARGRLIYSTGGGYICTRHHIDWRWGKVTLAEYLEIQEDIEQHEIEHDW